MKELDNPYKQLLDLNKSMAGSAGIQAMAKLGKIVSPPPNLVVSVDGMPITKAFIWLDEYWLQGHERHTKGHLVSATQNRAGGGGYAEFASHNHDIDNDYTENIIMTDTWHVGDTVLLIPIVGQDNKTVEQYAVLCKLVRLDGVY
ncbi:DUF2577 family protein [Veillonella ratti]|uniref:DUF2577 family protein n=1 Tax=Veillonella ratti TaxID=103892 RepID=UPI000F8F13CB|nr:DUF2577 family protein [Veillonella ratti]